MTDTTRSRLFKAGAAAALVVVVLVLAYLGVRSETPIRTSATEKLRIAVPVLPHNALVYVAAVNKYFADEGLDVAIKPVSHGAAAIGYVLDGEADLAVTAEVPFVIAVMQGNDLGMIASVVSANDSSIVARKDRAIANAGDLAGKKVGVTFGTAGSHFLWTYLIAHRIPADSTELVNLPPTRITQALVDGSVDAVATWLPISLEARAALGINAVSLTDVDATGTTIGVVGRSDFLKGHPKTIEKLLRALLAAERFMRSNPDESLNLVADGLQINVDVLRPFWKEFTFRVALLQTQLPSMEDQARWAMARRYVAMQPVPNFLPNLYLDALLAVEPARVTVIR